MNTNTGSATEQDCYLESFQITSDFHERAEKLRLAPRLWDIALAADGQLSAAQLAPQLSLPVQSVVAGLLLLEREGLVFRNSIQCPWLLVQTTEPHKAEMAKEAEVEARTEPLSEENSSTPTTEAKATRAAAAEKEQTAESPKEKAPDEVENKGETPEEPTETATTVCAPKLKHEAEAKANDQKARTPIRFSFSKTGVKARTNKATVSLKLGAKSAQKEGPAAAPKDAQGGTIIELASERPKAWKIQPVLDALRAKAGGDPMVGQLLAYRVFLRIPSHLLNEAGIRSVCLIEPELEVRDLRFKEAMEKALLEVAGLHWPSPEPAAA